MGDEPSPMKPASPEQAVFAEALQCATPEARAAYLDIACGMDTALRRRVEVLIRAAENAGDFLEEPPTGLTADAASTLHVGELSEKPGDRIGRYKLLEKIGEGGCGSVYMAEQEEPVRRRVALKVIKLGMDTKQVIARFEAERQALALMDHPNIAKVFDGGATQTGRPYFVMELVRGVRITEYCDEARLSTEARLRLFVQVCQAVQHAHQKGIIHRDLKPSNILVTVNDGVPVPKVIDFGIAKATGQRLTDKTLFTQFHSFIGTPAYTSPEQAEMSSVDIDTRSDIYSLGVLLYELLTGQTPFDGEELLRSGLDEMRRIIREQEPVRPSTRLSTLGIGEATELSRKRQIKILELANAMQGDLDWIVMKCIEKDRSRRYETANGLAMDIGRFLGNEPILARPPSTAYRLQKALRRNKIAFAGTGAVVVALVLGVIISAWQAVRATRAKAVALVEKQRAAEQAAIATSITEYLQQMLGSVDPGAGKGLDYSVRQLLDDYAGDLEKHLPHQPEVEATLRTTIGKAYSRLGELDKARKHLMRALVLRRGVFGDKHEKYADSLVAYAWTVDFDRREFPEREADLRQALAIYRARGVGGEAVIRALFALQWILLEQAYAGMPDKWKEIEPVSNEALAEARKSPGVDSPDIARIQGGLVHAKIIQSQYDEAEEIARESLATRVRLYGPEHFETAWAYYILGEALRAEHKFAGAIQAEKQALTLMRKVFSPQQRNIATALNAVIRTLHLADHSHALADLFTSVTKLGELESVFRDVLSTTKPSKVDNDDPALVAVRGLAQFREFYLHLSHELAAAGKTREAEESRQKAIQVLESLQIQLAGNPDLLPYVYSYGSVALTKTGEPQQAKELIRKLLDPVTPKRGGAYNDVAWFLATSAVPAHRDPTLAIELAKKAVESNAQFSYYRNTLGVARYRAGDWKQAISDLEKSVSLGQGGNSFDFFFLAMAHWKLGDKDKALECYERAIPSMGKQQPNEELRRFQTEAEELMKESPVK